MKGEKCRGSTMGAAKPPRSHGTMSTAVGGKSPSDGVIRTGAYPSPVHGGTGAAKGNASAKSPTAHPRSRHPKRA